MLAFRQLVSAALWAGLLAGLLLTAVQRLQVIPTLLQAEVYERQASTGASTPRHEHDGSEGHAMHVAWQPQAGWQRTFFTAVANTGLAIGFALLLGVAMLLRGCEKNWRRGLLWGAAGYLVFFIAPALGLPPEVPGTAAAQLGDRQAWWLLTVLASGAGLALLVFAGKARVKMLGGLLLLLPYLIGAPQPLSPASSAPAELAQTFVLATALANAVFWLALGGFMGWFYRDAAGSS